MLFDEGLEQGREQGLEQGREQGRQQGLSQGLAQGREQGLAQGYDLMNRLIEKLLADGRLEDLRRSASDSAYQKQLIDEYHLDTRARV